MKNVTFCRMPGEEDPHLGIAVRDPTLLDRVTRGLQRGLERTSTSPSTPLDPDTQYSAKKYLDNYDFAALAEEDGNSFPLERIILEFIRPIVRMLYGDPRLVIDAREPRSTMGQTGDLNWAMRSASTMHTTGFEPLTTIAMDATSKQALESIFEQASRSGDVDLDVLDIHLVKGGVNQILKLDDGLAIAVKMALHIHSAVNGRFGLLWGATFFAVTELGEFPKRGGGIAGNSRSDLGSGTVAPALVEFEGRTHLAVSDVCSMSAIPPSATAPKIQPFFGIFISLFMSHHPEYRIDAPSDDETRAWHAAAEELDRSTALARPRPMPKLDDAVVPLLQDAKTVIGLRHRPGSQIVCDIETNTNSSMIAMGVELECDNFFGSDLSQANLCECQETAPVLPWLDIPPADAMKLDRLDLVTPLGRGLTATVWKAKWSRRSGPGNVRRSSRLARRSEDVPVVAKVVPAAFASSVAREYFIYTQAVPRLSPEARAYIPKFFGLYRSGWDGGGFVLVMEDVGQPITDKEFDAGDDDEGNEARAAFELLSKEGLSHQDERANNVLRREDGRLFIIDWGEAEFYPPPPAALRSGVGKDAICDAEANTQSCVVAMGLVLECNNAADEVPEVLPWFDMQLADATKLDRLDLLTSLGHGRSDGHGLESRVIASIETWICPQVVVASPTGPNVFLSLSNSSRLRSRRRSRFYRNHGWDGGGFVLVVKDVGELVPQKEYASRVSEVHIVAQAAFRPFQPEGLHHWQKGCSRPFSEEGQRRHFANFGKLKDIKGGRWGWPLACVLDVFTGFDQLLRTTPPNKAGLHSACLALLCFALVPSGERRALGDLRAKDVRKAGFGGKVST
ncbi:BZ3500_MvSof-1268-A1-R1_Chr7-1g09040 [Microbotryum saponariae]|uniref:BZ3500_MvSof-1268-A1-R1_Chr7-1g09040 protein n=1 Tax=Microbotryum saponariae TaxID=289078 RepID=A0A2X0L076_9BASI|nr:BZ3501_MvSof-1269-A2-R1_Chr7-1g08744 [Microbotryum saponariae]SDA02678.1 BZ3500_MvSof-1268-A1-R1_Chr7-1g09040 [Microbotryum saponariae]